MTTKTIKEGFSEQLMEHATMGFDYSFIFPVKFIQNAPKTQGEVWITTSNHKLVDMVGKSVFADIVNKRATRVNVDLETDLVALANVIRRNSNLPDVVAPTLVQPESYEIPASKKK